MPLSARVVRFVVLVGLIGVVGVPEPAVAAGPPNVLVIVTDDQRDAGTVNGQIMPATRNLFVRGGTRYTNAFATTPWCCPSRASIMGGRYAHNHHVFTNQAGDADDFNHTRTIQWHLRRKGYRTGLFGKYMNNYPLYDRPKYFDSWTYFTTARPSGYAELRYNVEGTVQVVKKYSTDYLTSRATRFLRQNERRNDDQPWFMYLAPFAPHPPAIPARRHATEPVSRFRRNAAVEEGQTPGGLDDKPAYVQTLATELDKVVDMRKRQLRSLMAVDEMVATVFRTMRSLGEGGKKTLAIFTSDNGFVWGEHGLLNKSYPYPEAAKIPLMVRWPGQVAARRVDDRMMANLDIPPTIYQAVGVKADPRFLDGRSLFRKHSRPRMFLEYFRAKKQVTPTWASIYTPEYQYVEYYYDSGAVRLDDREYYDLVADPGQLDNLLKDGNPLNDPPDLAEIQAQLEQDRRCRATTGPQGCP